VRTLIRSLGPADVDVLINGQTGTGKEVVARQLHAASGRKGPFVALNCGALPETVFESEIFGHEAGAFTGAQKRRIGKLEYANGGTLFLDEIEHAAGPAGQAAARAAGAAPGAAGRQRVGRHRLPRGGRQQG
jgi:two-component system C4-dicarboxylate transport response regulator DctD